MFWTSLMILVSLETPRSDICVSNYLSPSYRGNQTFVCERHIRIQQVDQRIGCLDLLDWTNELLDSNRSPISRTPILLLQFLPCPLQRIYLRVYMMYCKIHKKYVHSMRICLSKVPQAQETILNCRWLEGSTPCT